MVPNRATVAFTADVIDSVRITSPARLRAVPPSPWMIAAVSSAAASARSTHATRAPSRAKATAAAFPLPQPGPDDPAPKTIAVLSFSRSAMTVSCVSDQSVNRSNGRNDGRAALQEANRDPRNRGYGDQAEQQREQIAPDGSDTLIGMDTRNGARGIVANPERRREQAEAHRNDDDHGIVNFVDADLPRDRKQQRREQHHRRNALGNAAENDEGHDRDGKKRGRSARQPGHRDSESA